MRCLCFIAVCFHEMRADHSFAGLDTISEKQFLDMLKTGVPKEKRDRMAAAAAEAGEPSTKKQKK